MMSQEKIKKLESLVEVIYQENADKLPFHGWSHIQFVRGKAIEIGEQIDADVFICESAALVHDVNYMMEKNSEPEAGEDLRRSLLEQSSYSNEEIKKIEEIILEAHTANRTKDAVLSLEAQVLSDADTIFKSLPITPVLFAHKYLNETGIDIKTLAQKVVDEQAPLILNDVYFYSEFAKKKYSNWAKTNLALFTNILESLEDSAVQGLLNDDK